MKFIFLILITVLLSITHSMSQANYPKAYDSIPQAVKEATDRIFIGEYTTGRGICEPMPNGGRRWRLKHYFLIKETYAGNFSSTSIDMSSLLITQEDMPQLIRGKKYLILLALREEKNADKDKVLAIVEMDNQ